ncbi:MAG TPA: aspartate kinase, partial [Deltaproteobacteria bacterium]|nr:aspartate kinase [Deltaproteobacteria bacterium]
MGVVVQKYGGTSVGSVEKIQNVARKIAGRYRETNRIVVVVSAMSGETDKLLKLAREMSKKPDPRELDVMVSTGEQVSVSLLAMALKDLGVPARSLLAHQIGIFTDNAFTRARIQTIELDMLKKVLENGEVAVVAG